MGTLRLIFALAVVCAHCWPAGTLSIGGENAVRLFYMTSGFLISFILVERKSYANVTGFYLNRYLRLYPTYFVVAVLALAFNLEDLAAAYAKLPSSAQVLLILSNLFIFGQDWVMFAGVRDGVLQFMADFHQSDVPLYGGLLIEPAWTLGLELTFYAIAPFVLPRRNWIWALLSLSLGIRIALVFLGLWEVDPWSYRFFPAELALFLIGSLAHQIGLPLYKKLEAQKLNRLARNATLGFAALCLVYNHIPGPDGILSQFLMLIFVFVLPLSFLFQNNTAWDRWLGNLSYPVYICHILVIQVVRHLAGDADPYVIFVISITGSLVFAYALDQLIVEPFEKLRSRVRDGAVKS